MKCNELSAFLQQVDALARPGPLHAALLDLKQVLDIQPHLNVSALAKKLAGLTVGHSAQASFTDLGQLDEWLSFVERFGKPAVIKDLKALISVARPLLQHGEGFALTAKKYLGGPQPRRDGTRTGQVREALVEDFIGQLERAIGDEVNFKQVLADLERAGTGAEITLVAKRFGGGSPRSRSAAMKAILARHEAVIVSHAKERSTRGRIAG